MPVSVCGKYCYYQVNFIKEEEEECRAHNNWNMMMMMNNTKIYVVIAIVLTIKNKGNASVSHGTSNDNTTDGEYARNSSIKIYHQCKNKLNLLVRIWGLLLVTSLHIHIKQSLTCKIAVWRWWTVRWYDPVKSPWCYKMICYNQIC